MSDTRLLLLGAPQLETAGRPITIGRRKDLALLAYLAVTGKRHTRDTMATLLWPESDQARARAALRKTIYRLRRVIGEHLEIRDDQIGLRPGLTVDVVAFRRLLSEQAPPAADVQRAIEYYHGDFMAGFTLPDCPDFDRWQHIQTEEHRHLLASALSSLVDHYAVRGTYDQAIASGKQLLSLDPLHEPAHRHLMQLYVRAGQRASALRQYETCVRTLQEELGVTPEPETIILYQQIKDRQLTAPAANEVDIPAVVPPVVSLHSQGPLVGRRTELERLQAWIDSAVVSGGRLLLVEGEPGIGKSRLLQEAVTMAGQASLHAMWVNCYQIEQDIPYQPVAEIIEQALANWPPQTFRALPPSTRADVAVLVPSIADVAQVMNDAGPSMNEAGRARLFRSLALLVETLAAPVGLLLTLDDAHWADLATLQFLHYLARRISHLPILILCSFRPGDRAQKPELSAALDELSRLSHSETIRLDRLTAEESGTLASALAPHARPELSRWLFRETDGNPLFVASMIQSLPEEVLAGNALPTQGMLSAELPMALVDSIRDRLRWLTDEQRGILEWAAVIGRRFRFEHLQALFDAESLPLLTALETLVQRQLLREENDGRYDFTHHKIRDVIYQDLNQARRRLLHRLVAEALEQHEAYRLSEIGGVLAMHFEQAGDWRKTIGHLAAAGERAARLFALEEAGGAYDRAFDLATLHPQAIGEQERLRLMRGRGMVRALLADFDSAIDDLRDSLELSRRLNLADERRQTLLQLGMIFRRIDDYDQARESLAEALSVSEDAMNERATAETLYHLGTVAWSQGDNRLATDYHQQAVDIIERDSTSGRAAMQVYHGRAESYYLEGNQPKAELYFQRSLQLARHLGEKAYEAENLLMLSAVNSVYMGGANYALALDYGQQAQEICRDYHLDWHLMPALTVLGAAKAALGAYEEGLALSLEGIQLAETLHIRRYLAIALDNHGNILRELNLWSEAEEYHQQGITVAEEVRAGHPLLRAHANLALTRLQKGERDVDQTLLELLNRARRLKRGIVAAHCLSGLAQSATQGGDAHLAADYADQLRAIGEQGQMREMVVQARLWQGEAARLGGEFQAAEESFTWAAEQADAIGRVRLQWDVQAALARLYAEEGRQDVAERHRRRVQHIIAGIASRMSDNALKA